MTGSEKRQTPAWEEPGPVKSINFARSPAATTHRTTRLSWTGLVDLVPELVQLEQRMKYAYANRRPKEDLLGRHWYNDNGGKATLARLIGNERGDDHWKAERRRLFGSKTILTTEEMLAISAEVEKVTDAQRAHDEANGRGILWTWQAWDVAHDHLIDVLHGQTGGRR